jgi:hypothetical protein
VEERVPVPLDVDRVGPEQDRRGDVVDDRGDRAGHVVGLAQPDQAVVRAELQPEQVVCGSGTS